MSYGMKSILRIGSLRSPPPIRLRRTSPRESVSHDSQVALLPYESCSLATPVQGAEQNTAKHSLHKYLYSKHGLLCPLEEGERWWRQPPKGDCISSSGARLACFPPPTGRLYVFRRQRRYKKWRRRRRTSPAQRYYITPEGGRPEPACKAKPITGRTLGAQGQRPGGAINPRPRKTTVGRLNGRPFYGQSKGQLRPTCTSYTGCAHQPSGIQESAAPVPIPVPLPAIPIPPLFLLLQTFSLSL